VVGRIVEPTQHCAVILQQIEQYVLVDERFPRCPERQRDASVGMLDMELLPRGANFVRAKTLWEIGLHLAGNPATPYGGNRDTVITIGNGSGAVFHPWLCRAAISGIEGLTRSGRVWRGRTPARNWT
jgi:hypothetical protein